MNINYTTEDIKSLDEENNAPTIVSGEEFHELMKYINSMLNPCPICGEKPVIIAVFENDESTEVKYLQLLHESDNCQNAHWFDETDNRFIWGDIFDVIKKWNKC